MIQMDQEQPRYQYKVLEPSDDYKQAKIEKSGLTATFTLAHVEDHQKNLATTKKELGGQIEVDKAMMQNVIDFHPTVATLSDEDLAGAAVYYEAKRRVSQNTDSLTTVSKQIDDYTAETDMIMKTLGFVPAVDPIAEPQPAADSAASAPATPADVPATPTDTPVAPPADLPTPPASDNPPSDVPQTDGTAQG